MIDIDTVLQVYLPYFGHFVMGIGYAIEQLELLESPLPSAMVLIGHLCVVADPRALASEKTCVRIVNLIFLISNILVFLYDFIAAMAFDLPTISEMDHHLG